MAWTVADATGQYAVGWRLVFPSAEQEKNFKVTYAMRELEAIRGESIADILKVCQGGFGWLFVLKFL